MCHGYSESIPLLDLMLLTALVEEGRMIEELSKGIKIYQDPKIIYSTAIWSCNLKWAQQRN